MKWIAKLFGRKKPMAPVPVPHRPVSRVPSMPRPAPQRLRPSYSAPAARPSLSPAPAPASYDALSTVALFAALSSREHDTPVSSPCAAPSFSSGGGGDFGGGGASSSWDSGSSSSDSSSSSSSDSSSSYSND